MIIAYIPDYHNYDYPLMEEVDYLIALLQLKINVLSTEDETDRFNVAVRL